MLGRGWAACPLAKLGRSSPDHFFADYYDQGYHTWQQSKGGRPPPSILLLPDPLLVRVLSFLPATDLASCALVCRRWLRLSWDPALWVNIQLAGDGVCADKALRCMVRRLSGAGRAGTSMVESVDVGEGARMTDRGLALLARRCPRLVRLRVAGCRAITDAAVGDLLARCLELRHLDVSGCLQVTFMAPEPPRRPLLLQYLDLTDCTSINDNSLRVIVRNCQQLVHLYLRRCPDITDAGVKLLPAFCGSLKELSISDCVRVGDAGLAELCRLGPTLRYLSVAKCSLVTDDGLKAVARKCHRLRYLNARGCDAVGDDALVALARSCPRLKSVDVGKCDISDVGLRELAEAVPGLRKLSLRQCELVTDAGVQAVAFFCRGLRLLNIQHCLISLDGYRAVKKYCKNCVIEHTNPGFF